MGKVFVVLDEEADLKAQRICIDKDPEEALEFVLRYIVPQLRKRAPCMDKMLERGSPQK